MAPWLLPTILASLLLSAEAAHIRPRNPRVKEANLVPKYASFPRHIKRQEWNQTTTTRPPQVTPVAPVIPILPDGGDTSTATSGGVLDQIPVPIGGASLSLSTLPNGQETVVTLAPPATPNPAPATPTPDGQTPDVAGGASNTATPSQTPAPLVPLPGVDSATLPIVGDVSSAVQPVQSAVSQVVTGADGVVSTAVAPVQSAVSQVVTGADGVISTAVAPVQSAVSQVVTQADGVVSTAVVVPVQSAVSEIVSQADGAVSTAVVVPVQSAVSQVVTQADGVVSTAVVQPVQSVVSQAVTNAEGVVSTAIVPAVSQVVTNAEGVVSTAVVPAVSQVVTNAEGVVSTAILPAVSQVVTNAEGVVSTAIVPAVSQVVTNAEGVVSTAILPVVTGADGIISSVAGPVVTPIVSAVTDAAGVVSSVTLPAVVVPPSVSLPASVVNSILSSVLGDASVTPPVIPVGVSSILGQVSNTVDAVGSQITSAISIPPIETTLPNGVVTTLPGTTIPTEIPVSGSAVPSGSSESVTAAVGASQSDAARLSGSAAIATTGPISGQTASDATASAAQATATASGASQSGLAATNSASGASDATAAATETPALVQQFTQSGPTSIAATGTDSLTAAYTNSAIVADQPSTTVPLATSEYGIPTTLPQVIAPPNSGGKLPEQPPDTEMIQIAFTRPLNYPFVISHIPAIEQIYNYLPVGIAYGLELGNNNITMHSLQPYDTTATQGFITTVSYAFIPKDMVDLMALQVANPASRFHHYTPESSQVYQLIKYVNIAFPVRAPPNVNGGPGSASPGAPGATPSTVLNVVDPLNPAANGAAPAVNPTSIGIGFAVVGGAALYGAAMFFVARRYRKRRSLHTRSPSLIDTTSMAASRGEMATGAGAALMAGGMGGRGHSGDHETAYYGTSGRNSRGSGRSGSSRGRDISAPVMAENSLGWN